MRTLTMLVLGVLLLASQAQAADAPRKPNVVIIIADDLGYADIGAQGLSKDVKTRHIDSIARNGVRFTNGYVSAPVCSPSRAGFFTGRYQQRFGFEGNPPKGGVPNFGLPANQVTLADEMKRCGYVTGMTGKWHLGTTAELRPPKRGFDEFYGFLGGAHGYIGAVAQAGQGTNAIRRGDTPVEEKDYLTDAITREAVAFIDRHKAKPFFLYVPYNAVHTPQEAPAKYVERFADVKNTKRKMMLAMLSALDDGVGQILGKLREAGVEEDTMVVFFTDNGGPTQSNSSANSPLKGVKATVWEGGIRIPFMMQWRRRVPAGQVMDHPVITLDLFPTILAAANAEARRELKLDGVNLLPWLEGKGQGRPHETLYWRFKPQWAVRDGDMKLVSVGDGPAKLYDLSKDPGEATDLAKDQPEVVKRLQAKYDAWNKENIEPLWKGRQERLVARREGVEGRDDN